LALRNPKHLAVIVIALASCLGLFTFTSFENLSTRNVLLQRKLGDLEGELAAYQGRADLLEMELRRLGDLNDILAVQISQIQKELDRRVSLRKPTLSELQTFLANDQTDKNLYDGTLYKCTHFSRDLKRNAGLAGFNFSVVLVDFEGYVLQRKVSSGHVLNGAYLADGRFVYIEPQGDKISFLLIDLMRDLQVPVNYEGNLLWMKPDQITVIGIAVIF
jgi:hypothetical protein